MNSIYSSTTQNSLVAALIVLVFFAAIHFINYTLATENGDSSSSDSSSSSDTSSSNSPSSDPNVGVAESNPSASTAGAAPGKSPGTAVGEISPSEVEPGTQTKDSFGRDVGISRSTGDWSGIGAPGSSGSSWEWVNQPWFNSQWFRQFYSVPVPSASLSANPSTIIEGQSSTVSWTSADTTGCSLEPGFGNVETNGARTTSPANTTTYTLSCSGPGGSAQAKTTITVIPRPRVYLNAPAQVEVPDPISLSWTTTNAESCSASGDWNGGKSTSGSENISKPRGTYTFNLSCAGPGGTAQDSRTVNVIQVPRCSFSSDPTSIILPQTATISWSCNYAQSCTIDQGIGAVNPVTGSQDVRPSRTTTYTLDCSGRDGSRSFQATVNIGFIPHVREVLPR